MKCVPISNCWQCRYHEYQTPVSGHYCTKENHEIAVPGRPIPNADTIPDFCTLPDYKG